MSRIAPMSPPYPPEIDEKLGSMMPSGVPPIRLFRTFVKNMAMTEAMGEWGRYELGRGLSLSLRQREIVIDRTCARCGCEYEWGVHISYFAERAGFDRAQIVSLTHGSAGDDCWTVESERLLIRAVDSLHEESDLDDDLSAELASHFDDPQRLDLFMLCGWYHAISFTANGARVMLEDDRPRFSDYTPA